VTPSQRIASHRIASDQPARVVSALHFVTSANDVQANSKRGT
jgi:hypothetical protein